MKAMSSLFRFEGKMGRLGFLLRSSGIVCLLYGVIALVFLRSGVPLEQVLAWTPLWALAAAKPISDAVLVFLLAFTLILDWALVSFAFRRAADANVSGWIAAVAIAPVLQIPVLLLLAVMPPRPSEREPQPVVANRIDWRLATQGVLAGVALTLFAVAVGALIFGTYGFGIFVVSPLLIGVTTAFLANRGGDLGWRRTAKLVLGALLLGGVALVLVALEGMVCIVLASPLAAGAGLVGGAIGRAMALSGKRSRRETLMSVALLPLIFAAERALPPDTHFSTDDSIVIAARPSVVWSAVTHMGAITSSPPLPFRLGVSYPMRGDIEGEGVGALRRGVFSTGIALERVTDWIPGRKLGFTILSDPPAMHEMSPYSHLNAPHVKGYFRTNYTSFEITPLGNGRSLLRVHADNELRLDPVLYWLPFARWIIHANEMRVLEHVRDGAQRSG
jgi:uncharacterized membrane protein YhaH (DUF805 family)